MNLFDKNYKIENLISSLFALEPRSKCKLLYILVVPAKCMQISGLVFIQFCRYKVCTIGDAYLAVNEPKTQHDDRARMPISLTNFYVRPA